jgi:serine/threonine protein kinase
MSEHDRFAPGTVILERYRVVTLIGSGGMGAVYEAEDLHDGRIVALKTLREDLYERDDLVERFEREARAVARIGHPNIVGVYAVGNDRTLRARFIVLERLRGADVATCLNDLGSLSPQSALAIALPVMDALIAAHAAGIVHRDIKPENVFLHEAPDGEVVPKLIDFGIAKVLDAFDRAARTAAGMVFGTPWYMSPEQALGDTSIDGRTDVWSVGAMIYEMLCGTLPFGASNPNTVMAQIIYGRPTPLREHEPDVPEDLHAVVHTALERDLDRRYPSMTAFRDALAACALWEGVTPAVARSLIPRPSALGEDEFVLPPDFELEAPADEGAPERPAPAAAAPVNEDVIPTVPTPHRAPDAPADNAAEHAHLATGGGSASVDAASVERAAADDDERSPRRAPRAAIVTALLLVLLCGGLVAMGMLRSAPSTDTSRAIPGRLP